jgi:hypothetical protein
MDIKIQGYDRHRNGVAGSSFYVILFDFKDEDDGQNRHMVAIYRPRLGSDGDPVNEFSPDCAVLDLVESVRGNIAMAKGNSWRGDRFEHAIRQYLCDKGEIEASVLPSP